MAGTPLSPTSRYIPPGTREFLFVPAGGIANVNNPTRAELEAGTDLTAEVADYSGFNSASDFVDVQDMSSRYTPQIPGLIKLADSQLMIWADRGSDDIRTVMPQDTEGFIVIFPEGDGPKNGGPGTLMDVWQITVGSEGDQGKSTDPSQRTVDCGITGKPALNVTIPAAS